MDLDEYFLPIVLPLGAGVDTFCFEFVCGNSIGLLLLVTIGSYSCVSSLGRIKSHIPCNLTTSSSSVFSSVVETSSSSTSDSTFDMVLGGLVLEGGFILYGMKDFFEEVSTTYFLISTISLDMVLRTFCKPSRSKGFLGGFFLDLSLKVTFLDFCSSNAFFLSKARVPFSIVMASFMFSAKVCLASLSTKITVFGGTVGMYHSF